MLMDDLTRFWSELVGRVGGPFTFRFVLQPAMAILFAMRDGIKDAHQQRPAYFWSIFHNAVERDHLLREGWTAVLRIIVLGVVMDLIYQVVVFRGLRPLELVVIVLLLAFVPYLLVRGPANRIARLWSHREGAPTR